MGNHSVSGSPISAFGDAVLTTLLEDDALIAIVSTRIKASLKRSEKTVMPYIVGGRRDLWPGESLSMQSDGGRVEIWLDFWSEANGPNEVERMMARARAVLQRRPLRLDGFVMIGGSLRCEEERVIPDFDPDMPQKSLFHGVQRWAADVDEAV